MHFTSAVTLATLALAQHAVAAQYRLVDNYVGTSFLTGFTHQAIPDPTSGTVNYVDQVTALAQNLTYAHGNTLILRADSKTQLLGGQNRNSVRIKSVKTYTTHVAVFDVRHMPVGCATWPAIWEVKEAGWPAGGEVDIVEGVNNIGPNSMTLHTNPGCTMPDGRQQLGAVKYEDCNSLTAQNLGCGVSASNQNSFGPNFNSVGGGYFVLERTSTFMKIWFWQRGDPSVPPNVASGGSTVTTDGWPEPGAYFPNTQCNLQEFFQEHNIIINLTLCGAWAGSTFNSNGCPGDCPTYVRNNPSAFANAYFDIAGVRVYQ